MNNLMTINNTAMANQADMMANLSVKEQSALMSYKDGTARPLQNLNIDLYEMANGGVSMTVVLQKSMQAVNQYLADLGSDTSRNSISNSLVQAAEFFAERTSSIDLESVKEMCKRALEEDTYNYDQTKQWLIGKNGVIKMAACFPWAMLTSEDIEEYIKWCMTERSPLLGEASIKLHLTAIKRVLFFCQLFGVVGAQNAFRIQKIKNPKIASLESTKRKGRKLNEKELVALSKAASKDSGTRGLMVNAMYETMKDAGIRRCEVSMLQTNFWDKDNNTLFVVGKGGKSRTIPIASKSAQKAINKWIDTRAELNTETEFNFMFNPIHKSGKVLNRGMTTTAVHQIIKQLNVESGVENFGCHDLRRTFATVLLESGVPLNHVQTLMGHSSSNTTSIYDKSAENNAHQSLRNHREEMDGSDEFTKELDDILDSLID